MSISSGSEEKNQYRPVFFHYVHFIQDFEFHLRIDQNFVHFFSRKLRNEEVILNKIHEKNSYNLKSCRKFKNNKDGKSFADS